MGLQQSELLWTYKALTRFCRGVCGTGRRGWKKCPVTKAKATETPWQGARPFPGSGGFESSPWGRDEQPPRAGPVDATSRGSAVFWGRENCLGFWNKLLKVLTRF